MTQFHQAVKNQQIKANFQQSLNAEISYTNDIFSALSTLSEMIFPDHPEEQNNYQNAIIDGLIDTIHPEIGIFDFWNNLDQMGCQQIKLENGQLNFYKDQNQQISLKDFIAPQKFLIKTNYSAARKAERKRNIQKAIMQLNLLKNEINKK